MLCTAMDPSQMLPHTESPYLPYMPYWQYEQTSHSMAQQSIAASPAPYPTKSPVEEFTCIPEGPEKQADTERMPR